MKELIDLTNYAAASDDDRPVFAGALLEIKDANEEITRYKKAKKANRNNTFTYDRWNNCIRFRRKNNTY